ncbi:MAG: DUF2330 domain-containing protein [Myxococcota bacterium]
MGRGLQIGGALLLAAASWSAAERAHACGGCFAPSETVTVVTGHTMAVAVSATETTLWDRIEYAGDPRDFAWVLPIQGENLVEVADNAFFEALDQATQIQLQGTFAPLQTACPDPCADLAAAAGRSNAPPADPEVTVFGQAVVGPYETATIGSEDPEALVKWLQDNGYAVSEFLIPTIQHYVDQGSNFAALRLQPGAGVNQMQPVRITTPGLMPVFPLRMVAAGVQGTVGLQLYIFGEGRWGVSNFEVAEIDRSNLVYDWDTASFNYSDVFDRTLEEAGERAWIAEFAQPNNRFESLLRNYRSFDDDDVEHTSAEDFAVVTRAIANPYLTKLRTELSVDNLDQDLVLRADLGADIDNFISVDQEINRPTEPRCASTCGESNPSVLGFSNGSGGGCAAVDGRSGGLFGLAALVGGVALLGFRRRRS